MHSKRAAYQRAVTVTNAAGGTALVGGNDNRVCLIIGAPVGVAGDGIFVNFYEPPTATNGLPHYYGTPPLLFHERDIGRAVTREVRAIASAGSVTVNIMEVVEYP